VETEVTERLKEAVNNIEGIKTLTSTLLTLFVIPVVYTLFSDLGNRIRPKPHHPTPKG
jgi:multidrug efflux pump subunit AcrB